jgi:cytidylate kinase
MNPRLFDQCRNYLRAHAVSVPAAQPRPLLRAVTLSRETGAGAVTIGQLVAAHLDSKPAADPRYPWAVFDRNLVRKILTDHKLPEALEQYMPEDAAHRVEDVFEDLLGVHPSSWTLAEHARHTIMRLAKTGNVILVGRGANFVTAKMPNVLHVRLIAPVEIRIRHVADYYQLGPRQAAEFVKKHDRARARYIRRHFKARIHDPLHYHLTINTGAVSYPDAARLIADAVLRLPGG